MLIIISSDYLKDIMKFCNKLSFPIQYYGTVDKLKEKFYMNSSDVMGYLFIQDTIKPKDLDALLKLTVLQYSSVYTPRVLLCAKDLENLREVVTKKEYSNIEISGTEYELLSTSELQRLVGTIYLECFDIFNGKRMLIEPIKHSSLPSLDARYILTGVLRYIFFNIERSRSLEDLLESDEAYQRLKKVNSTVAILREMVLYSYFGKKSPNSDLLAEKLEEFKTPDRIEYSLIKKFIEEDFDANVYREIRREIQTVSE